jgi:hypothetical protein
MAASNFEFFSKGLSYLLADLQHTVSSFRFDTSGFDNAMHLLGEQTLDMSIAFESATKAIDKFTDTLKNAKIPSGGGGGGGGSRSRLTDEEKAAKEAEKDQKNADKQAEKTRKKAEKDAEKTRRDNAKAQRQADKNNIKAEKEAQREQENNAKQQVQTARDVLFQYQGILKNVSQFYAGLGGAGAGGALGGLFGGAKSSMLGGIEGFMKGGVKGGLAGAAVGFGNGAKEGGAKGAEAGPEIMQGVMGAIQFFSKSLSMLTTPITALIGGFSKLTATVVTLVQAFNPALVQQFNATIKDLMAIFGAALTPMLVGITALFRTLADSIMPIIIGLGPAFQNLGKLILQFLVPIFQGIINTLAAVTPTLNQFTGELQSIFNNIGNVFKGLIEGMVPLFLGLMQVIRILLPAFNLLALAISKVAYYITGGLIGAIIGLSVMIGIRLRNAMLNFKNAVVAATNALNKMAAEQSPAKKAAKTAVSGGTTAAGGAIGTVMGGPLGTVAGTIIGFVIGEAITAIGSAFTGGIEEQKFENDNSSYGAAARSAEYTTVEQLSANLIKSAFSGSTNDKLGQLVGKANEQVELLQVIANKPAVAPAAGAGARFGVLP